MTLISNDDQVPILSSKERGGYVFSEISQVDKDLANSLADYVKRRLWLK